MEVEMSPPFAEQKDAAATAADVAQRRQEKMKKRRKVCEVRCRSSDPRNAPYHHGVVPRLLPTNDQESRFARKRLLQLDAESVAERMLYGGDEIMDDDASSADADEEEEVGGGRSICYDPKEGEQEHVNNKDDKNEEDEKIACEASENCAPAAAEDSGSIAATANFEAKPAPEELSTETSGHQPESSLDVVEGAAINDELYGIEPEAEEEISREDHAAEAVNGVDGGSDIAQDQKEDPSSVLLSSDGGSASEDPNQDSSPEAGSNTANGVSPSPVSLPADDDLLTDSNGQPRGAYITLEEDELEVLELLLDVYGKAEKQLGQVQNYTEHLLHYNFQNAGFPVTPCLDGYTWFSSLGSRQRIADLQSFIEIKIRGKLMEIDYCAGDQMLELHLSFLKTAEKTDVQPPHIDHKWENAVPPSQYPMKRAPRCYKGNYNEWVPFIALFPLTEDGMRVEVWHDRSRHDQPEHPEHNVGRLVDIPYGRILLLRADVIHAGGFRTADSGNPRGHFYIYKNPRGAGHPFPLSNCYEVEINGKLSPLIHLYKHHPDCADTSRVEFTRLYGKAESEK